MLKLASELSMATSLADLGVMRIQGADAVRFLQGQLSSDVGQLSQSRSSLAGFHSAQGRAIAILRLVQIGKDDLIAVLPRELVEPVRTRLARFVLRAKVKMSDDSAAWRVAGLAAAPQTALPTEPLAQMRMESSFVVCVSTTPTRWLVIAPTTPDVANDEANGSREAWRAMDIAAGLPQVYAATSEAFVGQMLNLDVLGGISFDKGCYTGQEVIARAHFRGRVKRRMQHFRSKQAAQLSVGDSRVLLDGRTARVVEAVQLDDGRCEFLAVAPLAAGEDEPDQTANAAGIEVETLPLPYSIP